MVQFRAPDIAGAFGQGFDAAQRNRLADVASQRADNMLALQQRGQEFREMDANRDYEFRVEARDFNRERMAEAERRAAAARAAAQRRGILDANRDAALRLTTLMYGAEPEMRQKIYGRALERFKAAGMDPAQMGFGVEVPSDEDLMLSITELGGEVPQPAAPRYEQVGDAIVALPTRPGEEVREVYRNARPGGQPTPRTTLAQLKADLDAGFITREQYDAQVAEEMQGGGGMGLRVGPDGSVEFGTNVKFTEAQSKDNVFSTRARGAMPVLDAYEGALASYGDRLLDADPTGIARGNLQSPDYQVGRAAADEFLMAILRKDTGAAITNQEMDLYGTIYLPRPGDSDRAIAFKRAARERAINAIEAGMSPAQMAAQERALARSQGVDLTGSEATAPRRGNRADDTRGQGGPRILSVEPIE